MILITLMNQTFFFDDINERLADCKLQCSNIKEKEFCYIFIFESMKERNQVMLVYSET